MTTCDLGGCLSWLGLGAQRAGTSWFTDLLTRHPAVCVGVRKELHLPLASLYAGASPEIHAAYHQYLRPEGSNQTGEFTPAYLRSPWVAPFLLHHLAAQAPVVVILRDPIDRYRSAVNLFWQRQFPTGVSLETLAAWSRDKGGALIWAGMYASQLTAWAAILGRDRVRVYTYEDLKDDPGPAVRDTWRAMGLDPVPLGDTQPTSVYSAVEPTDWEWDWFPGWWEALIEMYRPQVEAVDREWNVNVSRWRHFA